MEKRVEVQGHTLNVRTRRMLHMAEERLGFGLDIIQGSYNNSVSASGGTHGGGGAIDVSAKRRPNEVVRVLREVGFAAWHRLPSQGPWIEHIHAVAIADPELSPAARQQVCEYEAGRNGLANNGKDDGPRLHPIPVWPISLKRIAFNNVKKQFDADRPRRVLAIKRVQHCLNNKHHAGLLVDGIAGHKTRHAYREHMGHLTRDSLKKLCAGYFRVV